MADAFLIEDRHVTAGVAVRERCGYPFYSSDELFLPLDSRKFRRLQHLMLEVRRLAESARFSAPQLRHAAVAL